MSDPEREAARLVLSAYGARNPVKVGSAQGYTWWTDDANGGLLVLARGGITPGESVVAAGRAIGRGEMFVSGTVEAMSVSLGPAGAEQALPAAPQAAILRLGKPQPATWNVYGQEAVRQELEAQAGAAFLVSVLQPHTEALEAFAALYDSSGDLVLSAVRGATKTIQAAAAIASRANIVLGLALAGAAGYFIWRARRW